MKVAFLSQPLDNVLPPSQNSIGIWIYEVARRLARDNQVTVYANGGKSPPEARVVEGVTYRFLRAIPYRFTRDTTSRLSQLTSPTRPVFSSWIYSIEYSLQAAMDMRKRNVEIVHIVNFSQFIPIVRAFNPKAKIVIHMQCEWLSQLDRSMIARRLSKSNLVLGCSKYITNLISDRFPEYGARIHTVYNGVDETYFYPATESKEGLPPRLLFVSRLSPEKGVHVLLRAFQQVVKHHPGAILELIGSPNAAPVEYIVRMTQDEKVAKLRNFYRKGSYYDYLQSIIPEDQKHQVLFSGHVKHDQVPDHYRMADILINPSLSEPFGMALVEGMATGIPVIAPRVGGMVEIVEDGKTGCLVQSGDDVDLANAILRLLSDADLRKVMGIAGRERVLERFTWDRVVNQLLSRYGMMYAGENQPESSSNNPISKKQSA